jgi:hypothetical protein
VQLCIHDSGCQPAKLFDLLRPDACTICNIGPIAVSLTCIASWPICSPWLAAGHRHRTKIRFCKNGGGGYRSPCLMHAKQALCHLSYTPDPSNPKSVYRSTTWPEHQCRPHAVACVCVCVYRGASGDGHGYAGPCCTQAHTQTRTVRGCPRALEFSSKYDAHRGARTHDHKIKSLALCQLS